MADSYSISIRLIDGEYIDLESQRDRAAGLVVAFVFLGGKIPTYLRLNVLRFVNQWPALQVLLIVDSPQSVPKQLLHKVEVVKYERSVETADALADLTLNAKFRSGFWIKTLERLLALEAGHARYPERPLLHLEGDVMVFPGFPFEALTLHGGLSWLRLTKDEDSAALLFSKSANKTSWLVREITRVAVEDRGTSDMRALRKIAMDNPGSVSYLPSSPLDPRADVLGVFDAAPLGQWLFGIDPKNIAGKRQNQYSSPHHLQSFEEWGTSCSPSGIMEISSGPRKVRVNSLHLHSKSLRVLRTKDFDRLPEIQGKLTKSWSPTAFASWATEQLREIFSSEGLKALQRKLLRW